MTIRTAQASMMRLTTTFSKTQTPLNALRSFTSISASTPATLRTSKLSFFSPASSVAAQRLPSTISATITLTSPLSTSQSYRRFATTTTTAPPTSTTPSDAPLTWNDFFRLRKIRRYYNFTSSLGLSLISLTGGMILLAQQNLQALGQQMFGLDPMIVMGVWSLAFFGGGWLLGPLVGGGVWGLVYRRARGGVMEKEKDFFNRIRVKRVDPANSSMQNPVPDYYGEKITSVHGYRRWLKDQKAFERKRKVFVEGETSR